MKEHKGKLTSRKRSAQAVPGVSLPPTRLQCIYKCAKMDIQIWQVLRDEKLYVILGINYETSIRCYL